MSWPSCTLYFWSTWDANGDLSTSHTGRFRIPKESDIWVYPYDSLGIERETLRLSMLRVERETLRLSMLRVERERCTLDDPYDHSCLNAHLVYLVALTSHVLQHKCAPLHWHTSHVRVLRGGVYCCTHLSLVLQHESCAHLDNSDCLCLVPLIFATMRKPKGDCAATHSRVLQLRSETNSKPLVFQ